MKLEQLVCPLWFAKKLNTLLDELETLKTDFYWCSNDGKSYRLVPYSMVIILRPTQRINAPQGREMKRYFQKANVDYLQKDLVSKVHYLIDSYKNSPPALDRTWKDLDLLIFKERV